MKKGIITGTAYAFVHFTVEVVSFYLMFSRFDTTTALWWAMALLYDALAFIPQSFFGLLTDRFPRLNVGAAGLGIMACSLVIKNDIVSVVLVAVGNALVHVDGAQQTLRGAEGKITPDAIFVGAGSFGVITGQLLAQYEPEGLAFAIAVLMAVSIAVVFIAHKKNDASEKATGFSITADRSLWLITICAFICVAARGYIAYAIPIEWKKTVVQSVLLFVFMGAGKIAGGVLADFMGYRRVSWLSLLAGLVFLLFGNEIMILSLIGIALFSMTMPVTVAILVSAYPDRPGFAFGITTIGLFCGTLPAFFVRPETLAEHQLTAFLLTAVALICLEICIKRKGKL